MKVVVKIFLVILIAAVAVTVTILALNAGSNDNGTSTVTRGVVISEVMASNSGAYVDNNGNYSDWIEIYNGTGEDVDLSRLALSDDENTPIKWGFDAGTLKADGYLVVFMSGKSSYSDISNGIYHASFKLSASKETLLLSNIDGDVLDKQSWEDMDKNVSLGLKDGTWQALENATPGFPNTEEGLTAFKESRAVEDPSILITEVMGSNKTTITDNTGAYSDYIEVTNVSDQNVNLYSMGLSDDETDPMQWQFPNVTLAPGEQFIVWCSGDPDLSDSDPKKGTHANFRISTYKETILLSTSDGKLLDKTSITELTSDASWAREYSDGSPSSTFKVSYKPTPGYPNTDAGYSEFSSNNKVAISDIYISEVLTSNTQKDFEGDGSYYDFIEIYNGSGEAINLKDYALTNNTGNPAKWKFPDISIKAGEYKVVLASGLTSSESSSKNYMHATFKLSNEGDIVALYDPDGNLLDRYNMGYNPTDVSCGRKNADDVSLYFYTDITPGSANGAGAQGFTETPTFTVDGGIYTSTQKVEIKAPSGATIYYTTDNSTPTKNSTVYTAPITVSKTTILRAMAVQEGYLPSYSTTATYLMNVSHELSIISIVTDDNNLWGSTGIYDWGDQVTEEYKNNIDNFPYKKANFQQKWERPRLLKS
ncbi:MAG: lamin tail domain-containing protein [Eubacteriales bacterium]